MRKIVLLLSAFCILIAACDKTQKQPLTYSVTNDELATGLLDVYLPDSGHYNMQALVKFLNGYPNDSVKLVFTGLPAGVKVTPDTFTAVPTYTANFDFYTKNVPHGVYPITLTAYTPTHLTPQTYNFNLIVIPANAASIFYGRLNDSSACTGRTYSNTFPVGVSSGTKNVLIINNFAGFGPGVNVYVYLNQLDNTLNIPSQVAGNGSTITGSGTYTENKMIINYTSKGTPTTGDETCTAVYSK
jgi:hypothetical protein